MTRSSRFWYVVTLLAGAGTMLLEVTAPRLMQPWFGASTFVWTNVIGVILLALAIGYNVGGRLAGREGAGRRVGLLLTISAAIAAVVPFVFSALAAGLLPEAEALAASGSARTQLQMASFVAATLLFAPPVLLLGMISPHVVVLLVENGVAPGRATGRALMFGTLGSLAGTFLPTYWLVPSVGTRASFLIGAGILLVPGVFLLLGGRRGPGGAALALVLIATLALTGGETSRGAVGDEEVISEIESPYQYVRVVRVPRAGGGHELLLRIDEGVMEYHSVHVEGETLTGGRYYDRFALLPGLFPDDARLSAAILGSGAGTMARVAEAVWGERFERVVNVELDPVIIDLEEEFGYAGGEGHVTIEGDGRMFLATCSESFDILMVDAYARQVDIPTHMATVEFFRLARDRCRPGGVIALNVSALAEEQSLVQALIATVEAAGWQDVRSTPVAGFPNIMLWASRDAGTRSWEGARVPALLEATLADSRRFTHDVTARTDALVFTDDHAPVEHLTDDSLSRLSW